MSSTKDQKGKGENNNVSQQLPTMTDPLLLNYHDACVYKSDLQLIVSPKEWLNDSCINFQMTRLQQQQQQQQQQKYKRECDGDQIKNDTNHSTNHLYLDPAVVSYMMHQCDDDDLIDLGRSWCSDLRKGRSISTIMSSSSRSNESNISSLAGIFVPVNDQNGAGADAFQTVGAGNHWSMMLVVLSSIAQEDAFKVSQILHFDSAGRCNSSAANAVSARILRAISLGNGNTANHDKVSLTHCSTPQQSNGYDCGIFALGSAEALSDVSLWSGQNVVVADVEASLQEFVTVNGGTDFAKALRQRIANDIRALAAGEQS